MARHIFSSPLDFLLPKKNTSMTRREKTSQFISKGLNLAWSSLALASCTRLVERERETMKEDVKNGRWKGGIMSITGRRNKRSYSLTIFYELRDRRCAFIRQIFLPDLSGFDIRVRSFFSCCALYSFKFRVFSSIESKKVELGTVGRSQPLKGPRSRASQVLRFVISLPSF